MGATIDGDQRRLCSSTVCLLKRNVLYLRVIVTTIRGSI